MLDQHIHDCDFFSSPPPLVLGQSGQVSLDGGPSAQLPTWGRSKESGREGWQNWVVHYPRSDFGWRNGHRILCRFWFECCRCGLDLDFGRDAQEVKSHILPPTPFEFEFLRNPGQLWVIHIIKWYKHCSKLKMLPFKSFCLCLNYRLLSIQN